MGDGMDEGIDGPPYFRSANDRGIDALAREAHADSMTSVRQRLGDPLHALDRVSVLAAYRMLASGQHPDLLSLAEVERFPMEPPDGYVLKFTKSWGGEREYTYAALRAGDYWYTTSTKGHQQKMTWPELAAFIHDNPCSIATGWAKVPTPEPSPFEDMTPAEWHAQMWPKGATVEGSTDQS